ncbi:putative SAM-dependent methyltransferase [Streptococcus pneumoniae]|nr:putative SAM-dependent methyltransferase [Streptococcus pneumoniae]
MFSYTAAFSVAAAMGGASQTTSVDLAKRSRELSQAHFQANGLSTDEHHFIVMDVFEYFKYAKRKDLTYDVIVLDPPSFARNKKQTFSVAKDYHKLISQSLEILNLGGIIIASTNAANVSRQKFTEQIDKGFAGRNYQILNKYGLPADFAYNKKDESSNYLKVISMKVSK